MHPLPRSDSLFLTRIAACPAPLPLPLAPPTHIGQYGNAETNAKDTGAGSMEAVYWGNSKGWGHGAGSGPWVMADLENGLWAGNEKVGPGMNPAPNAAYVTAMVKGNSGNQFALLGGDATAGKLTKLYEGVRPNGYHPMKKQGAIILGIGGDNSDWAVGTFYEGVMTQGYASDATDAAVQANIVAAGYGKAAPAPSPAPPAPKSGKYSLVDGDNFCYETIYTDDNYKKKGWKSGACAATFNKIVSTSHETICKGHSEENIKYCPKSKVTILVTKKGVGAALRAQVA